MRSSQGVRKIKKKHSKEYHSEEGKENLKKTSKDSH
jgi:hypothetical protein